MNGDTIAGRLRALADEWETGVDLIVDALPGRLRSLANDLDQDVFRLDTGRNKT